jgi:hypothetical protein
MLQNGFIIFFTLSLLVKKRKPVEGRNIFYESYYVTLGECFLLSGRYLDCGLLIVYHKSCGCVPTVRRNMLSPSSEFKTWLRPNPWRRPEQEEQQILLHFKLYSAWFVFTALHVKNKHIRIFMSCLITSLPYNRYVTGFNMIITVETAGCCIIRCRLLALCLTNGIVLDICRCQRHLCLLIIRNCEYSFKTACWMYTLYGSGKCNSVGSVCVSRRNVGSANCFVVFSNRQIALHATK